MKITADVEVNLRQKEVEEEVKRATRNALKDVITDIGNFAVNHSPWLYGNNARSIMWEVGPGGEVAQDDLSAACYSTSGYGGYLETGTRFMAARPYFKPGLDLNIKKLPGNIKAELRTAR